MIPEVLQVPLHQISVEEVLSSVHYSYLLSMISSSIQQRETEITRMMTRYLLLVYCLTTISTTIAVDKDEGAFNAWRNRYQKQYNTELELEIAKRNFAKSEHFIESIKAEWEVELGKFADISQEDFAKKILMPPRAPNHVENWEKSRFLNSRGIEEVPDAFDWRQDGNVTVVTSVKDQGTVGTCWAFSTIGNIEGQWALSGHQLTDLSTEFLVDCDGTSDETHADCSIFGGWPYLAYDFIISTGGIPSDASWPYCAGSGDCYPCMNGPVKICGPPPYYCDPEITAKCTADWEAAAKIGSWSYVENNEEIIKQILYEKGPLSVLLDATQLQFYKGGIWDGHISGPPAAGCKKQEMNHAVLLVGYGEEEDTPFWIVKNSWGQSWGEQGYFRIVRGANTCGIANEVTTSQI